MARLVELARTGQVMAAKQMQVGSDPLGTRMVGGEQPLLEEPNSQRFVWHAWVADDVLIPEVIDPRLPILRPRDKNSAGRQLLALEAVKVNPF